MSKRSLITNITPLPSSISREAAVCLLHDHHAMIELNPLVLRHETTDPPSNASQDEAERAIWYEITDKINYLPGRALTSEVSYKACFYNLPHGLQTHVFAPAGVDIRSKWSIGGNMPGEPKEIREMGVDTPTEGLYIKEEVDLRCNVFMSGFVKKNLKKSHLVVAEKIAARAKRIEQDGGGLNFVRSPSRAITNGNLGGREPSLLPDNNTQVASQTTREAVFHEQPASAHHKPSPQTYSPTRPHGPNELHGSIGPDQCFCTGALHVRQCPFYPSLRWSQRPPFYTLVGAVTASRSPTGQELVSQRVAERSELPANNSPTDESDWPLNANGSGS